MRNLSDDVVTDDIDLVEYKCSLLKLFLKIKLKKE